MEAIGDISLSSHTVSFEEQKIPVAMFSNAVSASKAVADEIASLIRDKAAKGEHCVLGLATGSTPKSVYKELIRMHKEEGLDFSQDGRLGAGIGSVAFDNGTPQHFGERQHLEFSDFFPEEIGDLVGVILSVRLERFTDLFCERGLGRLNDEKGEDSQ